MVVASSHTQIGSFIFSTLRGCSLCNFLEYVKYQISCHKSGSDNIPRESRTQSNPAIGADSHIRFFWNIGTLPSITRRKVSKKEIALIKLNHQLTDNTEESS